VRVDAATSYSYYFTGELNAPTPGGTEPALLLMGGGDWVLEAFRWWVGQAGHGHIVILRAAGTDELQHEFHSVIGGTTSVETLVFHDRQAASDPTVLAIIRHADGVFIGGGDQAKYVHYWQGTPLSAALNEHVRSGKPLGGTSAGLAIMGGYSYGSLASRSLKSSHALADPLGKEVTLVRDFLHLPYLSNVITDSHFAKRKRLGRLVVFVARLAHEERDPSITGIGIDEGTALCIDAQGVGRVFTRSGGAAWLVRPMRAPRWLAKDKPLDFRRVPITGIGTQSTFDLKTFRVDHPAFQFIADAANGTIRTHSVRSAAPRR
jgi:cyanophycinase